MHRPLRFEPLEDRQLLSVDAVEAKLVAPDLAPYHVFGGSVAVSQQYAVVGAYRDYRASEKTGAAYVFDTSSGDLPIDARSFP